jgi:hypothetical protein
MIGNAATLARMTTTATDDPPAAPPSPTVGARFVSGVRRVTPWLLGAALLAFVLPFASVSCLTPAGYGSAGGGVTASYAGLTLVTGGEPALDPADRQLPAGASRAEDGISPQPVAIAALALATGALVLAIAAGRYPWGRPVPVAALAAGAAALSGLAYVEFDRLRTGRILAKLAALGLPPRPPEEIADFVRPDRGLWAVVGLLIAAAALNAAAGLVRPRRT